MARAESDREDLMSEAVALVRRAELTVQSDSLPIVVGFRAADWLSIYFGQDLMFQFDNRGRFRRAYIDGMLYRTQGDCVARMKRERTASETILLRQDLVGNDLASFQTEVRAKLQWFLDQLTAGKCTVVRQTPEDDSALMNDVLAFVQNIVNAPIQLAPALKN